MHSNRMLYVCGIVFLTSINLAGSTLFAAPAATGQKAKAHLQSVNHTIQVQWYAPTIAQSVGSKHARVIIRGKTTQGTRATIGSETYSFKSQKNYSKLTPQQLSATPTTAIADKNGNFQIKLTLPYTAVQIPIIMANNLKQSRTIILLLNVKKNQIKINVKTIAWNLWRVEVGPTFKYFDISESNSVASPAISSTILGTTVAAQYNFRPRYYALAALTSVQGVGSLPSNGDFTFNDFEVLLGIKHDFKSKWLKRINKSIEFNYLNASSPYLVRDAASNYVFESAAVNKLNVAITGEFGADHFFDSAVSMGLGYGILNSSKFDSSPGELSARLSYKITHQLDPQFLVLGELCGEYDTYSFSSYDPPSSTSLKNSLTQLIVTTNAAIAFRF